VIFGVSLPSIKVIHIIETDSYIIDIPSALLGNQMLAETPSKLEELIFFG
jgi:hypothetical protein